MPAEAPTAGLTDWHQIVGLHQTPASMTPGPFAAQNQAVAVAEVDDPEAGLALIDTGPARELDADRDLHDGPSPTCCAGSAVTTRRPRPTVGRST